MSAAVSPTRRATASTTCGASASAMRAVARRGRVEPVAGEQRRVAANAPPISTPMSARPRRRRPRPRRAWCCWSRRRRPGRRPGTPAARTGTDDMSGAGTTTTSRAEARSAPTAAPRRRRRGRRRDEPRQVVGADHDTARSAPAAPRGGPGPRAGPDGGPGRRGRAGRRRSPRPVRAAATSGPRVSSGPGRTGAVGDGVTEDDEAEGGAATIGTTPTGSTPIVPAAARRPCSVTAASVRDGGRRAGPRSGARAAGGVDDLAGDEAGALADEERTRCAMSSGWPTRATGICDAAPLMKSSNGMPMRSAVALVISVWMKPGRSRWRSRRTCRARWRGSW